MLRPTFFKLLQTTCMNRRTHDYAFIAAQISALIFTAVGYQSTVYNLEFILTHELIPLHSFSFGTVVRIPLSNTLPAVVTGGNGI